MDLTEDINFYRQLPATDYFHGCNSHGQKDTLLIVYQPNDKTLAREYYQRKPFWKCIGCKDLGKKVHIRVLGKEVYAPLKHFCRPRSVEEIVKEQQEYQNVSLYGNGELERKADFYTTSAEFDKFTPAEYKFGLNNVKRPNSRLIVQQKDNPQNVYHYRQQGKRWICRGCFAIDENSDIFGEFVNKDLYLPKQHVCEPFNAEESEKEQQHLISGKTSEFQVDKIFNEEKNALRMLYYYDYEYGVTRVSSINEKKKIIVCDQTDRSLAYEFNYKSPSIWQCSKCSLKKKSNTYVIQKDGNMYVSMKHKCNILKYFDIMYKQEALLNPGLKKDKITKLAMQKGTTMPMPKDNRPTTASAGIRLPSFSARPPSIAASTRAMKRHASKISDSSATSSSTTTPLRKIRPTKPSSTGPLNSATLAKVRRISNASDTAIKVFVPKKSPFPVKIPPSYITANKNNLQSPANFAHKSSTTPSVINYRPPPIISLAPVYLGGCINESLIDRQPSSLNSSPDYNALMEAENNVNDLKPDLNSLSSNDSLTNNYNADIESMASENRASFTGGNEKSMSMEVDDDDDDIQIIEPPSYSHNQSVSAALLQLIDSKIKGDQTSSTITSSYTFSTPTVSLASSPILPFENDKVADNLKENIHHDGNANVEMNKLGADKSHENQISFRPSPAAATPSKSVDGLNNKIKFEAPTDAFIRATLEKLKIPFLRKAFHFWADVLFDEISATSSPESTFAISFSNDSFFKCLSCFFTGSEKYYFFIKAGIQSYFYNNFKNFESNEEIDFSKLDVTSDEFQQMYLCDKLTNAHFNFICEWLQCRIGMFSNIGILERYGNWNGKDEENVPILLIQNDMGFYKPVLTLL